MIPCKRPVGSTTQTAPSPPLLIARTTSTQLDPTAIVGFSPLRCIRSATRNVRRLPKASGRMIHSEVVRLLDL
jgi:hypothetical protein